MDTKAKLKNEIVACGRDPAYFISRYVKIQHPVRGLIPFTPFDYQEELFHSLVENRFNIVLKARQLGISEGAAAYALWLILFHRDKNVVVMASKAETAKNIIRKARTAFKKLPEWLKLATAIGDNVLSLELTNGSRIKAIATASDAGRSEAVSLLIVDEAAFIEKFDELWTGLYPTVSAGGRALVMSTPNGVGDKFHALCVDAEAGENEFKFSKLMWWRHPERVSDLEDDPLRPGFKTSTWFRNEVKSANMSPREVAQELECDFLASGETVITAERLREIEHGCLEPLERELEDRALHVWWQPEAGKQYLVTADVARGDGRDRSAAHVFDLSTMEQAAEYCAKVPPDQFAAALCTIGKKYNSAMLVVENNSVGLACLEHVRLAQYPNVYYARKGDQKPGEAVNTLYGAATDDLVPGFTTSQKNRPLIINKLEEYLRSGTMTIRSFRMLEELRKFIWKDGRAQAMKGWNDDLVMAAAIAAWVRDTVLTSAFATADVQRKLILGVSRTETQNIDIPGACKDPRHVPSESQNFKGRDPMSLRLPNGKRASYGWLISMG